MKFLVPRNKASLFACSKPFFGYLYGRLAPVSRLLEAVARVALGDTCNGSEALSASSVQCGRRYDWATFGVRIWKAWNEKIHILKHLNVWMILDSKFNAAEDDVKVCRNTRRARKQEGEFDLGVERGCVRKGYLIGTGERGIVEVLISRKKLKLKFTIERVNSFQSWSVSSLLRKSRDICFDQ